VVEHDATDAADTEDGDPAVRDEGGFDDPQAVDPATDEPLRTGDDATSTDPAVAADDDLEHDRSTGTNGASVEDVSAPVTPIPVPVGAAADDRTARTDGATAETTGDKRPGSVTEPDVSTIFTADDASSFHERWRDAQLRFVDSPKEATAEAAALLDEAVEKLAASLRAQKDKLHNDDADDTEQLRIELRGYREIMNRVLDL
jgi:hypothetical protein